MSTFDEIKKINELIADLNLRLNNARKRIAALENVPGLGTICWETFRTKGKYYTETMLASETVTATKNLAIGKYYAHPFLVPDEQSFDRIAAKVSSSGVNAKLRLGIYKDNGDAYPGDLVLDSGELDASSTGIKEAIISETLSPFLYWLVCVSGTAQITLNALSRAYRMAAVIGFNAVADGNEALTYVRKVQAYGALPDPFPTGGDLSEYNTHYAIFLRKA